MKEKQCTKCQTNFQITDSDLEFYQKMEVPEPTFCPECRLQRRCIFINEMNLYKAECKLCHKTMLSVFNDTPFPVYCQTCWWSDNWDQMEHGKDFNFNRPFFEQLKELSDLIPRQSLITGHTTNENSEYTNHAGDLKNCYLVFQTDHCEDCYYSHGLIHSKNSIDTYMSNQLELCYQSFMSARSYNSDYLFHSADCSNSMFMFNCANCKDCFGCVNLTQAQYCINNKQLSKDEYFEQLKQIKSTLRTYEDHQKAYNQFLEFARTFPRKYMESINSQNTSGNYSYSSKNALNCFIIEGAEDVKYCQEISRSIKDCMDYTSWGSRAELLYEVATSGINSVNNQFCYDCWPNCSDMQYCITCNSDSNLFGCIGLKKKQYCIFNKQYTKEQYFELKAKIIEHMKSTGEYGEFFPSWMSPFHYNETKAQDYLPLSKEEALTKGFTWKEKDTKDYIEQTYTIPSSIDQVNESIFNEILACTECKRNYKIMQQELTFYKQKSLPIPTKCYFCRYKQMIKLRTPLKTYDRSCMKCNNPVKSPYAKNDPDIIYCEECYQNEKF